MCIRDRSQQCIAQGGYGSDGIHYFVRQYAGKPNPGIYFLFIYQTRIAKSNLLHFCIGKADKTESVEKMPLFRRFPIFPRIFRPCVKMFFYTLQDMSLIHIYIKEDFTHLP